MKSQPLLSICIPTYNRQNELRKTLTIIDEQFLNVPNEFKNRIEIFISDNHSEYNVVSLVAEFKPRLEIDLKVNEKNIGGTLNYESCFCNATGKYVLILSDDDHFLDGALGEIVTCLLQLDPDIVFLPFTPISANLRCNQSSLMLERNQFLKAVGMLPSLLSACIFRRDLIGGAFGRYLDTNMHHYFYFLHALEHGERFVYFNRQVLYCPYEGNAGGYNWYAVFGDQFFRIVEEFDAHRIDRRILTSIQRNLILSRILPTYFNHRIQGFTINRNFSKCSDREIFRILWKRCRHFVVFWLGFFPIYVLHPIILRTIKLVYTNIRQLIFKLQDYAYKYIAKNRRCG
jgi:abequosyltransferase